MQTEAKTKWIAALRSGKYPQGRIYLKSPDGYCCLGVLCVAVLRERMSVRDSKEKVEEHYQKIYQTIGNTPIVHSLMRMNDAGEPFSEIADFIESTL